MGRIVLGRIVLKAAILAGALLLPSAAFAQASLTGLVRDTSGAVLPGVTVEVASPVLIEKVRTAVTDGSGRFQIVNLRPGEYQVTFTLPGFSTVVREGITLSGAANVTVNAELAVGALEETVTVTGEAPVVDVQSTTRQAVLTNDLIDALPTARNYLSLARLIPGTEGGGDDVGGSAIQRVGGSVTVHGSRSQDQRVTLNGVPTQTLQAGGHLGGQVPDVATAAEVTIEHTAVSAELPTGGIRINFIPRDGGNTFANSTFFTFSNSSMQGNNFTQRLKDAGLRTPDEVKKNWDFNVGIGGPIQRDKLWFWFSGRRNIAERYVPVFHNKNEFDPTNFLYEADTSRRGEIRGRVLQSSIRLTWQATPRNKIAGTYKRDRWCDCPEGISATTAPDAAEDFRFPRLTQEHLEWTSPVTNRLLLEAVGMHLFERWGNMHPHRKGGSFGDFPAALANASRLITIQDQAIPMTYGINATFNNTEVPNYAWRAAMAYVTGTHNFKVGINGIHGFKDQRDYDLNPLSYRHRAGVPNRITLSARPLRDKQTQDMDFGLFAQDTITVDRITVGLAVRWDTFNTSFPEQVLGPGPLVPQRNLTFPASDNLAWDDITYRTSLTYDLRGDGRTAVKFTANKYLRGQTLNTLGDQPNPVNTLVTRTTRSWRDTNQDWVPDCVLTDPQANGECGRMQNTNFGTSVPGEQFDSDLLTGFGNREANWEFSAGVQHEVLPRVSLDVGYFRRIWQNLRIDDDLALGPNDFDFFAITVPSDSRLPNGGGYTLDGFRTLKESAFGRPANVLNTLAKKFGKWTEHWDGVDVNLNARLANGLTVQFGTSTGRTAENDCSTADRLPENNLERALQFCDRAEPFQTQVKGFAVYTIPVIDVQLSGTYRNVPGRAINAEFDADNAYLAANSTLGRPLAGGRRDITIELLEPNTEYLERRNELDLRFGKVLRLGGRSRTVLSVDLFNALNTDAVLRASDDFDNWLAPTRILNARVAKVSISFDF